MSTDSLHPFESRKVIDRDLIDNALRARRLYDQALAGVLGNNLIDGASIMGRVSGDWLNAEDKLSIEEYAIYQAEYRAEKEQEVRDREVTEG